PTRITAAGCGAGPPFQGVPGLGGGPTIRGGVGCHVPAAGATAAGHRSRQPGGGAWDRVAPGLYAVGRDEESAGWHTAADRGASVGTEAAGEQRGVRRRERDTAAGAA